MPHLQLSQAPLQHQIYHKVGNAVTLSVYQKLHECQMSNPRNIRDLPFVILANEWHLFDTLDSICLTASCWHSMQSGLVKTDDQLWWHSV